jgi:arylsulfatase A-like enzyme
VVPAGGRDRPPVRNSVSKGGQRDPPWPNIVFILADDFSMNLMSSKVIAESMPNLVAMMNEGVTFQNYFVTDSLCCPSRSSIFTGKFPHDTGENGGGKVCHGSGGIRAPKARSRLAF